MTLYKLNLMTLIAIPSGIVLVESRVMDSYTKRQSIVESKVIAVITNDSVKFESYKIKLNLMSKHSRII